MVIMWALKTLLVIIVVLIIFIKVSPVFGGSASKEANKEYSERGTNYIDKKFIYPEQYKLKVEAGENSISKKGRTPKDALPVMKPTFQNNPDIKELNVTWLGHSALLIQLHGMNIMIDPLFSRRTFPVNFAGPKRFSEMPITIEEIPEIDLLIISHDHYDHLDMYTIKKLDSKVRKYIVPLGLENHLKRFNVEKGKIQSMAWWEEFEFNGLTIGCTPAKHYSNRQLSDRGNTLYASWVLKDEYHQIYESGDTGFGGHFKDIHDRYGDFDFVMMDSAQYNSAWHDSHMFPEEAAMAAKIMGARISMPIHWGAFALSRHGWDDPPERFVTWGEKNNMEVVTPRIGETMALDKYQEFQKCWWRDFE